MKTKTKLGRNDPCHCGSGKKYKQCHLRIEEEEARQARSEPESEPESPVMLLPSRNDDDMMEYGIEDDFDDFDADIFDDLDDDIDDDIDEELWRQFEAADAEGKIALLFDMLMDAKLVDFDTFEMICEIRGVFDLKRQEDRARYAEVVQLFRETAPELYQNVAHYLHYNLISDALCEGRQEDLPELLEAFTEPPDERIGVFFDVVDVLSYHGCMRPLIDVMSRSRLAIHELDELFEWAGDEFDSILIGLILHDYVETTETPQFDDAALQERLAPFGELQLERIHRYFGRVKASEPPAWRPEDFSETVDAETWASNIELLLFDFMVDRWRCVGVPLTRSEMVEQILAALLGEQQVATSQSSSRRGGRRRKKGKRRSRQIEQKSPLIPTYATLNNGLAKYFDFLGGRPYRAGAVIELLPAYLQFLVRLNLIHPTEMEAALKEVRPIVESILKILDWHGCDLRMMEAVNAAWSNETLEALKNDLALELARQIPVRTPQADAQSTEESAPGALKTHTFRVTYQRDTEVWREIEISEEQTLHQLHRAIQESVGFDSDHLYSFYMSGRAGDKRTEYFSMQGARPSTTRAVIGDLQLRMKQTFLYLFDFGDDHRFDVQLIAVNPDASKDMEYPQIVKTHGESPRQYHWEDEDWEDDDEDWDDDDEDWGDDDVDFEDIFK